MNQSNFTGSEKVDSVKDIPDFVNREKEKKELKAILSGRPNFVYFVYGPINSGKTTLLVKVFEELQENYVVFYINFRGLETRRYEDFVRAMFTVKYQGVWEKIKEGDLFLGGVKFLEEVAKKLNYTIPVPKEVLKAIMGERDEEISQFIESHGKDELGIQLEKLNFKNLEILDILVENV
jgi:AAA+ ATPase superfamily predicted ATPase